MSTRSATNISQAVAAFDATMTNKPLLLLVDDDLRLISLLEIYLKCDGFAVAIAGSARQMHKALDEQPVALMVLDLTLPQTGGLAICRDLRANGSTLPIIMLTASGDDDDRIVALELGADDYCLVNA